VQEFLGHRSVKTTMIYTQVPNTRPALVRLGPIISEERPPAAGDLSPEEIEKLVSQALQKLLRESKG
jgi:hypothetical protein